MSDNPILVRLSDAGLAVEHGDDVRGRDVLDPDGESLGTVDDLLVDEGERQVRFLEVGSGGFLGIGQEKRLIPVEAVTRIDEAVHISTARATVASSPGYDPTLAALEPIGYYGGLYGHYGFTPYWGAAYFAPGPP